MGFRNGAYATVWKVIPKSNVRTDLQISIRKKNRETGEYETEFDAYVSVFGTEWAMKAAKLQERDRIKLLETDVTTRYDAEKDVKYYNCRIYSFDKVDSSRLSNGSSYSQYQGTQQQNSYNAPQDSYNAPRMTPNEAAQRNGAYDGDTGYMDDLPF